MPKVWNSVLLSYLWFIDFSLGFFVNIYSLEFTSHTLRSEAVEWITLMKPALTVAFQQTRWGLPAFTSLSLFSLCGRWHPAYVSRRVEQFEYGLFYIYRVKRWIFRFFQYFFNNARSVVPQITVCRRMLGSTKQLRLRHWRSDALSTRLDLIHTLLFSSTLG